jgi:hypothetical protein
VQQSAEKFLSEDKHNCTKYYINSWLAQTAQITIALITILLMAIVHKSIALIAIVLITIFLIKIALIMIVLITIVLKQLENCYTTSFKITNIVMTYTEYLTIIYALGLKNPLNFNLKI